MSRSSERRRPRRLWMLQFFAMGVLATHALLASAFAPTPWLSTRTNSPVSTILCSQNRDDVTMSAKKRRKNSSSISMEEDENYDSRSSEVMNEQQKQEESEILKKYNTQNDDDETNTDDEGIPKQTTLSGGSSLIFEMARRMLVWEDELYEGGMLNDAGSREGTTETPTTISPSASTLTPAPSASSSQPLPRWRPSAIRQQSIANVNPNFRTDSPIMTNAGYAGILRRNSRKKNKPSMWRHTLRIYGKMGELEREAAAMGDKSNAMSSETTTAEAGSQIPGVGTNLNPSTRRESIAARRKKKIKRNTAHHEAALVAASKLGMWEEALLIFRGVEASVSNSTAARVVAGQPQPIRRRSNRVTDNMALSVISACVKGSKVKHTTAQTVVEADSVDTSDPYGINVTSTDNITQNETTIYTPPFPSRPVLRALTVEERRKPLDAARDIILAMEEKHDIPLVSRHINPLASAYNRLGLSSEAAALIDEHLEDRTPPPPEKRATSKKSKQWKEKREQTAENPAFSQGVLWSDSDDDFLDDRNSKPLDEEEEQYNDGYEEPQLNVHQMKSKDRASYSLLVQGAAIDGDFVQAVHELQRMTDAGLHPNSRNLNSWNEVMERGCRPSGNGEENASDSAFGRRRRGWRKKRDRIWLGNLP